MTEPVKEKQIEAAAIRIGIEKGWWTSKFISPGRSGVPDRIFIRSGVVVFMEFKSRGRAPRQLQVVQIDRMRASGATVHVVDSVGAAREALT
jgi:hypothetical protein